MRRPGRSRRAGFPVVLQSVTPAPTLSTVTFNVGATLYQWSYATGDGGNTDTTGVASGSDFTADAEIYVDGVRLGSLTGGSSTYVNSTTINFTLPSAVNTGSPLRTSGTKAFTVVQSSGTSSGVNKTVTAWDFDTEASPTVWLDADSSYLTLETGVKVWAERGSTDNYSQTTLANQPANTATEATLGNKPAVKFDGSNDALATTSQFGNVATNAAYTLFMAFSIDALSLNDPDTYDNHCLYGDAGGFFGVYAKTGGGTPKVMLYNWDGSDDHVDLTIATGTGYIYNARHDGGSIYAGLGLTAPSSAVSGNTATTSHPMNLGYRGAAPAKWTDCNIGHLVMYNSVLTAPQRERAISKLKVFYSL